MEKEYPIYQEEKITGRATVERRGLYYTICCRCEMTENAIHKIIAENGELQADLGICVPMDGAFGLRTRIPVKRLGEGELRFSVQARNGSHNERFVPVSGNEPFPYISDLKNAYFAVREGQNGVVLKELLKETPAPDQQDNDQIP